MSSSNLSQLTQLTAGRLNGDAGATGVTANNGSIVTGTDNVAAVTWSGGGETTIASNAQSLGVSSQGNAVVGRFVGSSIDAFRWTPTTGAQLLGFLPGGKISTAYAVSADGSVVAGGSDNSATPNLYSAFRWTAANGMQSIGQMGSGSTFATAMNADGSIIVGAGNGQQTAFIWDAADGMRSIASVLEADGLNLQGFQLSEASAISPNGEFITGYTGGSGQTTGWLVQLPEPTSLPIMALGSLAALARRRRQENSSQAKRHANSQI